MNKFCRGLLVASFAMIGVMHADTHTNKTFLATRPVGVNLAMESTTWHTQIHKTGENDDMLGASFQAVGFYEESNNDGKLGKYFGFQDKNAIKIGRYVSESATPNIDFDKRHLLHDPFESYQNDGANDKFSGTLNMRMKRTAAGLRLDYQQGLDGLYEGLYVKVRVPIVWEEYKSDITVDNSVSATVDGTWGAGVDFGITQTLFHDPITSVTIKIADYFCGTVTQSAATFYSSQQAALTKAKMCGNHDNFSVADIDVLVGWSFHESEHAHAGVNFGVTIPTSSSPKGEFVWESQSGLRDHWAVGAGIDSQYTVWNDGDEVLEFALSGDWRHILKDKETRTIGVKGVDWGQYMLFGQLNQRGVFPAANVLTQEVDVRPGNQVDARFGLTYRSGGFSLDAGYSVYGREAERVSLKGKFTDDTYAFAGRDYRSGDVDNLFAVIGGLSYRADGTFTSGDMAQTGHSAKQAQSREGGDASTAAAAAPTSTNNNAAFLKSKDLDPTTAESPSFVSHKIFAGLGYATEAWDTPVMLGVGGSYEFTSKQSALEGWAVWGKVGVTF